jgi:hypothetical protein
MNPWGLVVVALALLLVFIGAKGSQKSVWAALTGGKSSTSGGSSYTSVAITSQSTASPFGKQPVPL